MIKDVIIHDNSEGREYCGGVTLRIILRDFLVDILRVAHTNPITNVSRTPHDSDG
jgi:hypothetical protein